MPAQSGSSASICASQRAHFSPTASEEPPPLQVETSCRLSSFEESFKRTHRQHPTAPNLLAAAAAPRRGAWRDLFCRLFLCRAPASPKGSSAPSVVKPFDGTKGAASGSGLPNSCPPPLSLSVFSACGSHQTPLQRSILQRNPSASLVQMSAQACLLVILAAADK